MTTEITTEPKDICDTLQTYRKKYIQKQYNTLFDEYDTWFTKEKFLSDNIIRYAIKEPKGLIIGYFVVYTPDIFGLDIDDHLSGKAWKNEVPSVIILNIFNQIIERFSGQIPSFTFRSDRGIHPFYKLSLKVPFNILELRIKQKLKGIKVEIKPTPKTALRLPTLYRQIDPITFKPIPFNLKDIKIYHPVELFDGILPCENMPVTLEEKRERMRGFKRESKLARFEKAHIPFSDGLTNNAYCEIASAYYFAGLTEEEAVHRFQNVILFQSPYYKGGLTNENELKRRIKSSYKNLGNEGYEYIGSKKAEVREVDMFDSLLIEKLVDAQPFSRQRQEPVRRFLRGLFRWFSYHDTIWKDKDELANWDYFYRYYRNNRKNGYYPLPKTFLLKQNDYYYDILRWLKQVGFLTPAPFKYSANLNICKYYKVDRETIVESNSEKLTKVLADMKACGLTQTAIAKGIGVDQSSVSLWFSCKRSMPIQRQSAVLIFLESLKEKNSKNDVLNKLIESISKL